MSRVGNWISRWICRAELTDPLSGFFMLRRQSLEEVVYRLSNVGFKILIDIFASSPRPVSFAEIPFTFRQRQYGSSKLDVVVIIDFVKLLSDKTFGRFLPIEFAEFMLVGAIGVLVHVAILAAFTSAGAGFQTAQIAATVGAIIANYNFNNSFTYRFRRLRGARYWRGLVLFGLVCAAGAYVNVSYAELLFDRGVQWWIAGGVGAFIGGVWNYSVSAFFVWRTPARPKPRVSP